MCYHQGRNNRSQGTHLAWKTLKQGQSFGKILTHQEAEISRSSTQVLSPTSRLPFFFQLTVGEFSVQVDIRQAHNLANEARLVGKQLKELQNLAILYNNREKIFGMKVTNVSVPLPTEP